MQRPFRGCLARLVSRSKVHVLKARGYLSGKKRRATGTLRRRSRRAWSEWTGVAGRNEHRRKWRSYMVNHRGFSIALPRSFVPKYDHDTIGKKIAERSCGIEQLRDLQAATQDYAANCARLTGAPDPSPA